MNHRNRIFGFRPNTNLWQSEITEYSAENEYSVIFGNYRIFGKLPNIRQVTEYFTVSGTTNSEVGAKYQSRDAKFRQFYRIFGNFTEYSVILPNIWQ